MTERWISLTGAVNVRDLGGLPTADGSVTRFGRMFRSDNLQDLTDDDVTLLVDKLGVRDVIDLRTQLEVTMEGPGPLTRVPSVRVHHHSLYPEVGTGTNTAADPVLPWVRAAEEAGGWESVGAHYTSYLEHRPDSVISALRAMATSDGASITHCAAGKDRTGVICALALAVAGVRHEAIIADYIQTGERVEAIIARLRVTRAYAGDLDSPPLDSHLPDAQAVADLLVSLDEWEGRPVGWLESHGWTEAETTALRTRLLG